MLISKPPPLKTTGKCPMCGRHNQDLKLLVFWDYYDFACKFCEEEIQKENMRKLKFAMEHCEPAE